MTQEINVYWNKDGRLSYDIPNRFIARIDAGDWEEKTGAGGRKYAVVKANGPAGEKQFIILPRQVVDLAQHPDREQENGFVRIRAQIGVWAALDTEHTNDNCDCDDIAAAAKAEN